MNTGSAKSANISVGAKGGGFGSQGVSGAVRNLGSLTGGSSTQRKVTPPRPNSGHSFG